MDIDEEAEKPYSDILSYWRQRESSSQSESHGKILDLNKCQKTKAQTPSMDTSIDSNANEVNCNEDHTYITFDMVDDKQADSKEEYEDDSAKNEGGESPLPALPKDPIESVTDFYARKLALSPRTRKMSLDSLPPLENTSKQPLGYIGTMALLYSRKYSDQFDLDTDIYKLTGGEGQFSRSWHFDRVKTRSFSTVDVPIEPNIRRAKSQKDNMNTSSLSDIMQRYKNAKKKMQNEREKSSESDSDSDMETMKSRLQKGTFESTLVKVEERNESIGQRLRRICVSSLDNLKPIEEKNDVAELDGEENEEDDETELRSLHGDSWNESRFSWSGNNEYLGELKTLTSKMKLNPYLSQYGLNTVDQQDTSENDQDENAAIVRIDRALEYIRNELRNMETEDQILAKKLIYISKSLRDLRLQQSYDEYRTMIDDTESSLCENHTMDSVSSICEVPAAVKLAPSLRDHGITKMNISRRRFSVL